MLLLRSTMTRTKNIKFAWYNKQSAVGFPTAQTISLSLYNWYAEV